MMVETVKKCKDCGMNEYLSKPLNMDKMIKVVTEHFLNLGVKINK